MGFWLNLIPWQIGYCRLVKIALKRPYLELIPYLQIWYRVNANPMYYTTSNTSLHRTSTKTYMASRPKAVLNAFVLKKVKIANCDGNKK